jgi:hypothetical protein
MGAQQIAGERQHAVGAPAVLLALETQFIEYQLQHYRDEAPSTPGKLMDVKPIYALGFSAFEAVEVVAVMHRALVGQSN